jgi:hypothetical protein
MAATSRPKATSIVPIQIPEFATIKHKGEVFRDGWISMMMCGKSGCGKTQLMAELIPYISDCVKTVIIATKVVANPFHLAIKAWCGKTGRPCAIVHDPQVLQSTIEKLREGGHIVRCKKEVLLIFDDFAINGRSDKKSENAVVTAFTQWRNIGINIVVVCQDASMVATQCRNCTNLRVLFASASKDAIRTFMKDVQDRVWAPELLKDLIRYIGSVPYTYIMVKENPLEVCVGKGTVHRTVMTDKDVEVPTYEDLMDELGAKSMPEARQIAFNEQVKAGNTAQELEEPPKGEGIRPRREGY